MMIFNCPRHQWNANNGGCSPHRLAYDGPPSGEIPAGIDVRQAAEVRNPAAEQQEWERVRNIYFNLQKPENANKVSGLQQELLQTTGKYNEWVQEEHSGFYRTPGRTGDIKFGIRAGGRWSLDQKWALAINANNIDGLAKTIDQLLKRAQNHPNLSDSYREKFQERLTAMQGQLTEYLAQRDAQKNYEALLAKHEGQTDATYGEVEKQLAEKKSFESKPLYQRFKREFDLVLGTTIKDPNLQGFWEDRETGYGPQRTREMEQLFFAILSENTKGFTDAETEGFLLDPAFGTDGEKNKDRFPFLYKLWVEKNGLRADSEGGPVKIMEAQNHVKHLEQSLEDDLIPEAQNLIGPEVAAGKLTNTIPANPGNAAPEVVLKYHEDKLAAEKLLVAAYRVTLPDQDSSKKEYYKEKAVQMERHVALEEAYKTLYRQKIVEAEVLKTFTRQELAKQGNEDWLMRATMLQFQKAVDIVDHPLELQGTNQFHYHPDVRRELIAMIFHEGVSDYRQNEKGETVYHDKSAKDYEIMLKTLALSPEFNQTLHGKFYLKPETKAYLRLAYHSNVLRTTGIPAMEKRVADLAKKTNDAEIKTVLGDKWETYPIEQTVWEAETRLATESLKYRKTDLTARFRALGVLPAQLQALGIDFTVGVNTNNIAKEVQTKLLEAAKNHNNYKPLKGRATPDETRVWEATTSGLGRAWLKQNPSDPNAFALQAWEAMVNEGKALARDEQGSYANKVTRILNYMQAKGGLNLMERDTTLIDRYLKNPASPEAKAFLDRMQTNYTANYGSNADILGEHIQYMDNVEFKYNSFDLEENSRMDLASRMGLKLEGTYEEYIKVIAQKPDFRLDQWEKYFGVPGKHQQLVTLLQTILPESRGKQSFLISFEALQYPDVKRSDRGRVIAMGVYNSIRSFLNHKEKISDATNKGELEYAARLQGMNIGDQFSQYGRGIVDMVIGPGQSPANRLAGMLLLYTGFKVLMKAKAGGPGMGNALRMLLLAGAVELTTKSLTGRGWIDRFNLFNTLGIAAEGTYEAALLKKGEKIMEKNKISIEEHLGAMHEMNQVPFSVAVEWYENTTDGGYPLADKGKTDQLWKRMNINTDIVLANRKLTFNPQDKDARARFIVRKMMENFFLMIAAKEHGDSRADHGKEVLKERWIQAVRQGNLDLNKMGYSDLVHQSLVKEFHGKPDQLTWRTVRDAEMDPADAEKTVGQNPLEQGLEWAKGKAQTLLTWTREEVYGPFSVWAGDFFKDLGHNADDLKDWLVELGKDGASNLRLTAEGIKLKYRANELTIRRFVGNHWEITKEGLTLPFKIIYAADQATLPFVLKSIRQGEEILRSDKLDIRLKDLELSMIVQPGKIANNPDIKANPEFTYFGIYQSGFVQAFKNQDRFYKSSEKIDPISGGIQEMPDTGYLITEVTQKDIDAAGATPEQLYDRMIVKSVALAREKFMIESGGKLSEDDIKSMMFSIHTISKAATSGNQSPEKLYMFWRMPMPGSPEYDLIKLGRWPDYVDPNQRKDRIPFMVDPSKTTLENFKEAYKFIYNRTAREMIDFAGRNLAQVVRLAFGIMGTIGDIAKVPVPKKWEHGIDLVTQRDEQLLQWTDEVSGSAGDKSMSEFYKVPANKDYYKACLDYAFKNNKPLNLTIDPKTGIALPTNPKTGAIAPGKNPWRATTKKAWHEGKMQTIKGRLNPDWFDGK